MVTGAGSGLGRAVAIAFAQHGADVAVIDLDQASVCETAHAICAAGRKSCVVQADVSEINAAETAVRQTVEQLGRLDILVNNAGTWSVQPFLEITEEEWDRVFRVNTKGLLVWLQAAARHMSRNGGGRIINISSLASRMALPNYAAYAASKAAVDSITRSAAAALGKYNIRVNTVSPGRMDTSMQRETERRFAAIAGMDVATFVKSRTDDLPAGRRTSAVEVAEAIVWLAGPNSDYMTGARLNLSGGLEMNT